MQSRMLTSEWQNCFPVPASLGPANQANEDPFYHGPASATGRVQMPGAKFRIPPTLRQLALLLAIPIRSRRSFAAVLPSRWDPRFRIDNERRKRDFTSGSETSGTLSLICRQIGESLKLEPTGKSNSPEP